MNSARRLTVQLLGPVALLNAGVPIPIQGQRQVRFLAALALKPGQVVTKEAIIADSWDGEPPRTVSGQLQTSTWRIRTALEAAGLARDVLVSHRLGYQLHVPADRIDLFVFREAVKEIRELYARGDFEAAGQRIESVLAMWKGAALTDVTSGRLRLHAECLDRERAAAIELRARIDIGRAKFEDAIAQLSELVDQDPLREDLYIGLMKAYYGAGRQADAIQIFHRAREILRDQIGINPGVKLKATMQAVLQQDELYLKAA
ncbi:AfsR/SARP family transcriptional regulator [Streptomyces sp. NPDC001970]